MSLVGSPGTATSATRDLTQHGSLSPGLCWPLVKESHSPPTSSLQVRVLLGHKEMVIREETAICEVTGAIKSRTDRKEYSGHSMRLGTFSLFFGNN